MASSDQKDALHGSPQSSGKVDGTISPKHRVKVPAGACSNPENEEETVQAFKSRIVRNRQRSAEEKLRRVNKVLRRAEVSKVANLLRKRLEYAKFKVTRGWTEKSFPEIRKIYHTFGANTISTPKASKRDSAYGSDVGPISPLSTGATNEAYSEKEVRASQTPTSRHLGYGAKQQPPGLSNDIGALLTKRLREETNAYFAKLGIPSMYERDPWTSYLKSKDSTNPYFPSPTPSPLPSRACSPTHTSIDAEAEEGAMLLMMLQHPKS
ncbi:hypothetical protein SpCBS45565_g07514 [Spizellomyces sp. 'palustris']|nr:hypothetical protein SpCBS45565_g07514 [Spizellomyces sp. 'palustris']